jgi:hypothetical protein
MSYFTDILLLFMHGRRQTFNSYHILTSAHCLTLLEAAAVFWSFNTDTGTGRATPVLN